MTMIVCPNCDHLNPEGASQCESCYAPLPKMIECPNCHAPIQSDATFCGQCGFNLIPESATSTSSTASTEAAAVQVATPEAMNQPTPETPVPLPQPAPPVAGGVNMPTQLQVQVASLFHLATQTRIELPLALPLIHIGKPNDLVPPDIDVSGFPDSDIVSRRHADIRVEGDSFYLEDVGSANGTYVNHVPLAPGNRHRLRSGDRISLGKGDKVTFIFQLSEQL